MTLQEVGPCKSFSTDLTLVRLLLGVHADMSRQMIEPGVRLVAFAA